MRPKETYTAWKRKGKGEFLKALKEERDNLAKYVLMANNFRLVTELMAKVDAQGHELFENYTKRQRLKFWASNLNNNAPGRRRIACGPGMSHGSPPST